MWYLVSNEALEKKELFLNVEKMCFDIKIVFMLWLM